MAEPFDDSELQLIREHGRGDETDRYLATIDADRKRIAEQDAQLARYRALCRQF